MHSRSSSFTIALLCSLTVAMTACGGADEAATQADTPTTTSSLTPASIPAPAPKPPAPSFDRNLLVGTWDTSIDDPENGMRLDLQINYEEDAFAINGSVTVTDPDKPDDLSPKSFVVKGTWTLVGEILTETPNESTFPLWRIGVSSPATVKTLDDSTFAFERSGALMTFTRI